MQRKSYRSRGGAARTVSRIIAAQVTVVCLAALMALVLGDGRAAMSAVVGGGIALVTTGVFALKVFSARPGSSAARVAAAFVMGEVIKLGLTVVLFAAAIIWLDVSFLVLILSYAATLLAYWLTLPFLSDASVRMP